MACIIPLCRTGWIERRRVDTALSLKLTAVVLKHASTSQSYMFGQAESSPEYDKKLRLQHMLLCAISESLRGFYKGLEQ